MTTTTGEGSRTGAVPGDSFAHRLMLVRAHAGYLTVKDAAERCGLNYGSWSNWERGAKPRDLVETVDAIAASLGIDRNWLLFGGPLAAPAPRQRRRSREEEDGLQGISWCPASPERPGEYARRPRDNRPAGHPSGAHPAGVARTALIPRNRRRGE
ncbi:MAG TPA: helix-turn-helix transcriptional regulator [Micromonosporaceae bacterium]|nr:helix-turn-helix transcriptional regulator [Micromonosporaceae bacterium]